MDQQLSPEVERTTRLFLTLVNHGNEELIDQNINDEYQNNLAKSLIPLFRSHPRNSQSHNLLSHLTLQTLLYHFNSTVHQSNDRNPSIPACELPKKHEEELLQELINKKNKDLGLCTICQTQFETVNEIRTLSCNHSLHIDCYRNMTEHAKKSEIDVSCPNCRKSIKHYQRDTENSDILLSTLLTWVNIGDVQSINFQVNDRNLKFFLFDLARIRSRLINSSEVEIFNQLMIRNFLFEKRVSLLETCMQERDAFDEEINTLLLERQEYQKYNFAQYAYNEIKRLRKKTEELEKKSDTEKQKAAEQKRTLDATISDLRTSKNQLNQEIEDHQKTNQELKKYLCRIVAVSSGVCTSFVAAKGLGLSPQKCIATGLLSGAISYKLVESRLERLSI